MTPSDFLGSLDEVKSFLKEHRNNNTTDVQGKILLRSKTKSAERALNAFVTDLDLDIDDKLTETIEALEMVNQIEILLPQNNHFEIPRMKYASIGNFLRNHLVSSYSHSTVARNYSTATILSNLLMDQINHIEKLPQLPPFRDPELFNRSFGPVFNTIVSTCGVYTSLLSVLPIVNNEDMVTWFSHIFKYMKLFEILRENFNISALLSTGKVLDAEKLMYNAYNIANTHYALIENLILAFKIFNTEFPEELLQYGILQNGTTDAFIDYLDRIQRLNNKIERHIDEAKSKRWISLNIDITSSSYYQHYLLNSAIVNDLRNLLDIYGKGLQQMELIRDYLNSKLDNLNKIINLVGTKEELLQSSTVTLVIEEFEEILPFLAIRAVNLNDPKLFFDVILSWELLFERFGFDKASELNVVLLLSKLYLKTHLNDRVDFHKLSQEIAENLHKVILRPRLYVTLSLLKIIADSITGEIHLTKDEITKNIKEIGIPEDQSKYAGELEEYLNYLFNGGEIIQLQHRKNVTMLDAYSWLIPDFTNYSLPSGRTVEYLPFNRKVDSII